ncbi:unnamed protein product [Cylindrotheca closterium]|uniref:Uncharacterized protein n=1 Tax=Cylindrotheca closterium TaxID=2856 RepID=A0AAD2CE92_9STRA|nr:unnamed protein product [Cylindrotheca closterium]
MASLKTFREELVKQKRNGVPQGEFDCRMLQLSIMFTKAVAHILTCLYSPNSTPSSPHDSFKPIKTFQEELVKQKRNGVPQVQTYQSISGENPSSRREMVSLETRQAISENNPSSRSEMALLNKTYQINRTEEKWSMSRLSIKPSLKRIDPEEKKWCPSRLIKPSLRRLHPAEEKWHRSR